jgi:GT2 family glycosyltransferase
MISKVFKGVREWNYSRLTRRRLKRAHQIYPPKHLVRVCVDVTVNVLTDFGSREAVAAESISFPEREARPVISIIVSAYGKVDYTLRCLKSLSKYPPSVPYEVIVIEDASGDSQARVLREVRGLVYIENDVNLGYLRSNNKAVSLSRGEYVHLLNNDTQVLPGAFDALHMLCVAHEKSMVGSKLIYPDGTLQEAGGIVWADASAWNFGRNDHPARWQYNYVREVDYCSGASIFLRRSTWDAVGGYDEWYLPAYCEDSDLAFKIRQFGGKVYYQPASVVIHDEGVSHGVSVEGGVKKWQVENTRKLHQRWGDVMRRDGYACEEKNLLKARDRARSKKTVMIIDHYLPKPDRDAGSKTMMSFIEALQNIGCVVKFWSDNLMASPEYIDQLTTRGVEIFAAPEFIAFSHWLKILGEGVDVFFLSRPLVAKKYIDAIKEKSKAKIIYYGHDLHFARMEMQAHVTGRASLKSDCVKMRDLEMQIWQHCDVSLYPSSSEVDAALTLSPLANVQQINAYCLSPREVAAHLGREALTDPMTLLFVAGFKHPPNEDAAVWLVKDILPIVARLLPGVKLLLVGSDPTTAVRALAGRDVVVTGSVSSADLDAYYQKACVAVVPLRFGAGVKLKVLEAMAQRVPVVTTSVGAQGLSDASFLSVTDEAEAFAQSIVGLLHNKASRDALAEKQAQYILDHFSREAMSNMFRKLI